MSDFEVKVTADLDTTQLESKLNDLQNKKMTIQANVKDGGISNLNNQMQQAQNKVNDLSASFKGIASAKIKVDALNFLKQQTESAVQSVTDLNQAMTLVSMTMSNMSNSSLNSLKQQSLDLAKDLSTYTKNVTDAITIYANENESVSSMLAKAQPTVLLSAASGMKASSSADAIQGILNQFDLSEDQAMHVADTVEKLSSEIALDFSKGCDTISQSIATSGSVVNEAGMSFEKYAALVSTIAETTRQSGSQIGNAFKTIFSRISRSKDGQTTDAEKSNAEKAFNSVGVSVRGVDGDLRDVSDTLDDLNKVWGTLNKSQKSYVAEQAAGVRQKNIFVVAMNNYNKALQLEQDALDSDGTAMEINDKRADSINGRIEKLSATMTKLYSDALPEDAIEGILDFATAIAQVVDNLGLFQGALSSLGVIGGAKIISTIASNWTGLLSALTSPVGIASLATGGAVAAITAYKQSVQEMMESAKQAGSEWEESQTNLQGQIDKITELREALSEGTLTEQEAADAKSELLSIQESLTDSYGDQVQGIDLINGSLEQQIELLDKVSQKQSENFLNENKKGIDKATKEMEKNRHNYLGQFYDNGSDESEALKASVQKLQKTYGDEVIKLEKGTDGITMNVAIDADATTAKDALNDFMTEVSDIEKQYGESDTLELLSDNAAAGLTDVNDVLEEYQSLYEQAQKAEMKSDKTLFSADGKEQTAAKWISDYAKAVQEYNDAVSDGDDTKIKEAATSFNTLDSTMQELSKGSMSEYADQVQEVRDQLNETAIANDKFTKAVKGSDSSDFGKTVSDSVNALKELNLTDTDFKYAFETDGIQDGEDAINSLVDTAVQCGVISDTSSEQVGNLVNMLVQLGVISSSTGSELDTVSDSASNLSSQIENVNTALSGIEKANSLLNSQSTGQSISIDDFNSDELADYTSALEYNNGALQLNAEKVKELQKAKAEEAIQTNDNQKLEKQNQYMENIAQIEQLQEELRGLADAKSDNAQSIQDNIDALLSENDSIVNQCNQLDLLSASLREATGAYQNWLDKQNASESGDMFDDAMGAMQHIDDTLKNTDSEYYGRTGREDYKAAVDFIVPDTIDHEDAEAVSSYIDSIDHFFNHDSDGNRTGLDIAEVCAKATKAGLMELDEASGEYKIAGQRTIQDFVDGLNLSKPVMESFFGEMSEFGGKWDWSDEAIKTLGDLGMAAGEAKSRIEEMSGDTGMNIQIDASDIDNTEDKISTLDSTIQQMQDYKGTVEVDSSQVDDANAVIQYCVTQKQMLEQPAVMSVDASQVDGEIGNALSLLQQFQQAQNNVELQAAVGADTSEAQGQVDSLVSEIQGLSPEIQAKLNIDTTSADTITASLQGLTPEIMVQAGVDSSLVDAWASEEKKSEGKVNWTNETGAVDAWAAQMHTSNGQVTWTNDVSQVKTSFTATGTVHWTNTTPPSGGTHGVNGTAHAAGTAHYDHLVGHAYAEGNWGTKTGGTTLVGELGRELVVDPGSGTWHTVGDNGAEFTDIPAGSIVFNHKQTEALLERGFVAGRGTARANGTAMVTGGISVKQANIASGRTTYSGSKSTTDKTTKAVDKAAKDVSKAAKDSSKWTDPWKNVKDWFERVVTKLQGIIDLNKAKSDNTYDYNKQNSYANNSISTTETLISKYRQAEKMYTKKSDQYAKKIGLSSKLKKKVQNGTVNIESLSAVNKQKVDAYQKWYDKILNCKKQIEELKTKEKELYKQKLDNITTRYDALIGVYSKANDSLDGLNSWREEIGSSQAVGSDYYNAVQQKVANGNQMRTYYKDEISALTKEYGNIVKKYGADSTFAKETLSQIEELKNTFYENEKATAENTNKLAELNMTMAENAVDKYTRASDALSSYRDFKEKNSYKHSDYGNVTENDYVEAMKVNDKTILAYQHQKDLILTEMAKVSVDSPKYQEYAKQLADVNKNILEANNDTADLKKSLVELRFKPLEDARDTIELLVTDLDNLRDMMDSDTFMNDDGSMTKQGLANIALLNKASEATKQQLANDKAQLETIQQMYDNDLLTEDQYKQYIKDINSDIQKSSKAIYSYQQSLMQVYLDQISKENDYLQENINKRKTALTAKKDYYDYDKTLKSKNKDIDTIKAQIAALEGTTNASAKARLEQLKADLKDKEDDLADTKYQHQIEMEEKGYENLSDQANDTLDKTTQAVKSNSDLQKSIIDNMLKETQKSYSDAYEQIEEIIKNTGYSVSESFDEIIAKAKLTSEEVKKVSPSVTASGEGVDNQRTDKNQADQYTKNAANSSSTGANATKDYSNANPSTNDLSESGTSGQQNTQLNNNLKNTVNNAKNVVSESMKEYNAKKSALQQWYNGVGGDVDKTKLKEKHHDFYTYFWKKGKNVRQKDFEEVARILGHNYIIKQPYSKWKKSWKDKIFNELKGYGFSNGGVINSVIPMDSNSIYGEYLSRSDDTGMIFARPGESVMTEKFTELLKPSLATMDQFTKLANPQGILPNTQITNQDITFSPNIEINVDSISNDMDLKHLGKELSDIMYPMFTKRMRKDLSRSSGKNR